MAFLPPILFILLWVVILLVDNLVKRGSVNLGSLTVLIGIMLAVYSLPYWCAYALIMIKSNAKQNLDSFKKSVAYGSGLGFLAIFLSEDIWGDDNTEINVALLAAGASAVLGALATLLLPKPN